METNLNKYIKKSHLKMVEKFNAELEAFRQETESGNAPATLYEDAFTSFTLNNIKVENGRLLFEYDGKQESETIVRYDEDEKMYYEEDLDGIAEWIKFWRACLRRAKRYFAMDTDKLDKIQDGEIEDDEEDNE